MSVVRTGLPCRHILQSCSYLDMLLFDVKLVNKRWTTVSQVRFSLPSWNGGNENSEVSIISKISSELEKATLTQIQKYRKLLKIIDPLASVGSEHGMKI